MNYLILIAVILGIIVLVRLMTVVQLSMALTNANNDDEQARHNKSNGIGFIIFMVAGLGLMVYMTIRYSAYMLPVAASEHGPGLDSLLNINFLIIGVAFFLTQILLFYFANKYRHSHERKAFYYPDDHKLEIIWTVVPAIVLTTLIITGLKQWNNILMTDKKDAVNVQLYGYQFAWIARYSGADNTLGKSNYKMITDENPLGIDTRDKAAHDDIYTTGQEMHLPLGQGIMFQFNSRDVIHSAYMPHFRTQMNVVPGMNTHFYMKPTISTAEMRKITKNDKFDYVLLCNKICGVAHYTMKMKIVVDTPAEFEAWLRTQKKASSIPAVQPMAIATEVKEKTAAPAYFEKKLNSGYEIKNASPSGIESKLIAFIEDRNLPVDKTTWFSFDHLLFETGKATLMPSSQEQLMNIAEILKAYPDVEIKIGGYTDNVGNATNNKKLSDERAKNVMAGLVKLGIDAKRLAAEGYGQEHPVAGNDTEEGRAQNRRIDVRITKKPGIIS